MSHTKGKLRRCATKNCEPKLVSLLDDQEKNKPENFPPTSRYQNISRNVENPVIFALVKRSLDQAKLKKNQVCCNCKNCFTNVNCKCRKAALEMERMFGSKPILRDTPLELSDDVDAEFDNNFRFVCGENCNCNKSCKLRALDHINDCFVARFEVIRFSEEMGFCLISKKAIKKGFPVIEFTGEFCSYKMAEQDDHRRYCLALIDEEEADFKLVKFIQKLDNIDPGFKKVLMYKKETFNRKCLCTKCVAERALRLSRRNAAKNRKRTQSAVQTPSKKSSLRPCTEAEEKKKIGELMQIELPIGRLTRSKLSTIQTSTRRTRNSARVAANSARVSGASADRSSRQTVTASVKRVVAIKTIPSQQASAPTSSDTSAAAGSSRQTRSNTARVDAPVSTQGVSVRRMTTRSSGRVLPSRTVASAFMRQNRHVSTF
ncbi:hypothetical protein CAEBREN_18235 [Caenorhabditis brenneri]|uniref:SET domain-containing protein n=1 Tax=Caenorhabditis brenneri TaxID=135651 RepID=G0M6I2_CAEBE|nr:hypothetical protein CAEBREN_18235 [Caenorhabditis brenneri]